MKSDAQRKLVSFLEQKAFQPVLRADPERYSGSRRQKLAHVQKATQAEVERFRHYGSAEEVVVNFKRDLTSGKAKQVHRELRDLDLPTIEECRDDFLRLAQDLGAA
jgi:hypothetical protein